MQAEPSISLACINFQRTGDTVHLLCSDEFAFLGSSGLRTLLPRQSSSPDPDTLNHSQDHLIKGGGGWSLDREGRHTYLLGP